MDLSRIRHAMQQGCTDPFVASRYYKKDTAAPDYQPVADASNNAATKSAALGQAQLAQAQSQYDNTMKVAQPVVDQQLALMHQQQNQGDDYYNYMVANQRPLETSLQQEAMNDPTATQDAADRALITGGNTDIYNARQGDIENQVGNAVADARSGQANTTNQMIRQAMRYGWSPDKLATMAGSQGLGMASQQAAAANGARNTGIAQARGLIGQDYNMRKAQESQGWAKQMDAAGLYRGLTGASQGAYGLAGQMGSSAVANQMAPSNAMMAQKQSAAGTIMQGTGQQIQGLGSVLNAQTSAANAANASAGSGAGAAIGAIGSIVAMMCDRRLKKDIVKVGDSLLPGVGVYLFRYIWSDDVVFGFMADEVAEVVPEAVFEWQNGFMAINLEVLASALVTADENTR